MIVKSRINMLFILFVVLTLVAGCAAQGLPIPEATMSATIAPPPTKESETTASVPEILQYPLFCEEVLVNQPQRITGQEKQDIQKELADILSGKQYDETARALIHNTLSLLYENYPNFQYLFGFLNPPDTATFIRENILLPLDTMVETLTCTREGTGGGWANDITKEISIDITGDTETDGRTLIHELAHMVTTRQHNIHSSNLYHWINEGDATLHQLTILGGYYYRNYGDLMDISRRRFAPDSDTLCMQEGGFGGGNYSDFSLLFFKLLALTDFETMALFDLPKGEFLIREELGRRYGEEGLAFYDSLTTKTDFDTVVATESAFLKLFLSRLSQVETGEQMLSYLVLYKTYRLAFSPEYLRIEDDFIAELPHPMLDYAAADAAVAKGLLDWGVLNQECLTEEEAYLTALVLAGRTQTHSTDDYWERWDREFYQPLSPFALCGAWYTVDEDVVITCQSELFDGEQTTYFEEVLAWGLHAMQQEGLLPTA